MEIVVVVSVLLDVATGLFAYKPWNFSTSEIISRSTWNKYRDEGKREEKKGVKEEMSKKDKRTNKVVGTRGLSGDSIESKEDSQVSDS